ncbi:MAG: hypothetical protein FJY11_06210 [Bacteroidetes bacterium]|nr:hypothetical protein [Bacteroidota bacterium]
MKRLLIFTTITLIALSSIAQEKTVPPSPVGNWTVDAPYAPEGFQKSKLTIKKTEEKYSVEMNFEEIGYVMVGERVSFIDGVFKFGFYVEGEDVTISLKFDGADKLVGAALTTGGEIPLTALRIKPKLN